MKGENNTSKNNLTTYDPEKNPCGTCGNSI